MVNTTMIKVRSYKLLSNLIEIEEMATVRYSTCFVKLMKDKICSLTLVLQSRTKPQNNLRK